jgi:hypothetical protein
LSDRPVKNMADAVVVSASKAMAQFRTSMTRPVEEIGPSKYVAAYWMSIEPSSADAPEFHMNCARPLFWEKK